MALNIYLCRIKRASRKMKDDEEFFRMYNEKENKYDSFGFPAWALKSETDYEQEFFDWDEYRDRTGIDIMKCKYVGESATTEGWNIKVTRGGKPYTIDMADVNIVRKTIKIVGYTRIWSVSRLFNEALYDDIENGEIGRFMWDKKTLYRFMEKYCQEDDEGYSFKDKFKESIIDRFEEGKMCAYISW